MHHRKSLILGFPPVFAREQPGILVTTTRQLNIIDKYDTGIHNIICGGFNSFYLNIFVGFYSHGGAGDDELWCTCVAHTPDGHAQFPRRHSPANQPTICGAVLRDGMRFPGIVIDWYEGHIPRYSSVESHGPDDDEWFSVPERMFVSTGLSQHFTPKTCLSAFLLIWKPGLWSHIYLPTNISLIIIPSLRLL